MPEATIPKEQSFVTSPKPNHQRGRWLLEVYAQRDGLTRKAQGKKKKRGTSEVSSMLLYAAGGARSGPLARIAANLDDIFIAKSFPPSRHRNVYRMGASQSTVPPAAKSADEVCPVDHKTRQAWLDKAKAQSSDQKPPALNQSCDSSALSQSTATSPPLHPATSRCSLDQSREISTIPRAGLSTAASEPANNEHESGPSSSGNWIYPSEQMFFDAMKRKSYNPRAEDMRSIIPIHNAVNERAWAEIKAWERGRGSEKCGGPKLVSFSGQSTAMTPKARINSILGYTEPFDRHDWVVDRCGQQVEYVIDFYSGKDEGKPGKSLNFYLDVRPKLNSFEGWKMRAEKLAGL